MNLLETQVPDSKLATDDRGAQVLAEIVDEHDSPPPSSDESDHDDRGFLHRGDYWEEEEKMHKLAKTVLAASRFGHLSDAGKIIAEELSWN